MRKSIFIPLHCFSINAYHYADKRHKTQAARDWEASVLFQLNKPEPQKAFAELREAFEPTKHAYCINLTAYYPLSQFINKSGLISQRTIDLTNWEKPLVDLIFLPKHYNQPSPYGCKNLNIDDKYLIRMTSQKRVSHDASHGMLVKIALVNAYGKLAAG